MQKFHVSYRFHGRTEDIVEAESEEALTDQIEAELCKSGFHLDPDEIDDVDYDIKEMHPVTRDGREIWTTYTLETDTRGHQSALASAPLFATAQAVAEEGSDPCPDCGKQLTHASGGGVKCTAAGCGYWFCY